MNWVAGNNFISFREWTHTEAIFGEDTELVSFTFDEVFDFNVGLLVGKSNWFPVLVTITLGNTFDSVVSNNGTTIV